MTNQPTAKDYSNREARIRLTPKCNYRCFFCHGGGGFECEADGGPVTLVSPDSPLALAAFGKCAGDLFTVNGRIDYQLKSVA